MLCIFMNQHFDCNRVREGVSSFDTFQVYLFIDKNKFGILNFGHCDLPFDLAQGGELVEPFGICYLKFLITETLYETSWNSVAFRV